MNIVLNNQTRISLENYLNNPSHALALIGPTGSGKRFTSEYIISSLLQVSLENLHQNAHYFRIQPETTSISIDVVHELQHFIKLKSMQEIRVVSINDADSMSIEAQNAMLKVLEEPPKKTYFILTVSQRNKLLPTIRSRVQQIDIKPVNNETLIDHFEAEGFIKADISRCIAMSGGLIGLTTNLLSGNEQLTDTFQLAKDIVSKSYYQRLNLVDGLSKQVQSLPFLMFAIGRVIRLTANNSRSQSRLQEALRVLHDTSLALSDTNPNAKLLLTNLMVHL